MNRLLIVFLFLLITALFIAIPAGAEWTWNDPTGQMAGNWNFPYDDEDPFTIGLYCCWFDLIQRMIDNMSGGYSSLGMSTDPYEGYGNNTVEALAWTGEVDGKPDETTSYCPSCHPEKNIKKPNAQKNQVSAEIAYIRSLIEKDETLQKRANKTYISSLSKSELLREFGTT
ncbi:MAG: hypothetical protein JXA44_01105 [Methanospirillaceae archaeon]|nr:hypothetical protein [Methanospirillaceae archaeon]